MPRSIPTPRMICAVLASASAFAQAAPTAAPVAPPVAAVKPVADTYFGTTVTDGYRYMEDLAAPEVRQWARGQADFARATLDAIPGRAALLARLRQLDDSVKERVVDVTRGAGGLVFYEKRDAGEEQLKLYVRKGFQGEERLLVDPDKSGAGGGPRALEFYSPSNDGRSVAYGVSAGGSEEAVIHVVDVATGKELIEPIDRATFSWVNWLPDDKGFVYMRLQALPAGAADVEKLRNSGVWLHRMAGKGADTLLLAAGVNESLKVSLDEFPFVNPLAGTGWTVARSTNGVQAENELYAAPAGQPPGAKTRWRKLFGRDAEVTSFAVHGDDLYVLTHQGASRYKVLRTRMAKPDLALADVVVAPGREVVDQIAAAQDALYVRSHDGTTGRLYRVAYARGAQPVAVPLPATGAIAIVDVDVRRPGVIVTIDSWTHDEVIVGVGARDAQTADTGLQVTGPFGAPDDLVAEEVLVKSHDGLQVPLSIVHRKGMKLDGNNPTELDGYGAYGAIDDPVYIARWLGWYEMGGVMATCHVRGGGIYGEQWHLAGKELSKPNTWRDLIACGEYLVEKGYTSRTRLAIDGTSAGGIAVGRAMTTRPDLFAAVVSQVGDLDTVRDETTAAGPANVPEFGSVSDKPQFNGLLEMDSFHHVVDGVKYPAMLLTAGMNDPRVPAWQALKMAARVQAASTSGKPVLLRLQYDGGHGIGSTKSEREETDADRWSFMLWQFGDARFQPPAR